MNELLLDLQFKLAEFRLQMMACDRCRDMGVRWMSIGLCEGHARLFAEWINAEVLRGVDPPQISRAEQVPSRFQVITTEEIFVVDVAWNSELSINEVRRPDTGEDLGHYTTTDIYRNVLGGLWMAPNGDGTFGVGEKEGGER